MINLFNKPLNDYSDIDNVDVADKSEEQRIAEFAIACSAVKAAEQAIAQIISDFEVKQDVIEIIQSNWHDPSLFKAQIANRLEGYTQHIEGFRDFHPDAQLYVLHEARQQLLSKLKVEVKAID